MKETIYTDWLTQTVYTLNGGLRQMMD